ncbi:MAG: FMN-binding glutamate synthase family protein [Limnochordales bacterium]|nr:FMN-binding glutamate synthase family protein [Bacillota bacterium]
MDQRKGAAMLEGLIKQAVDEVFDRLSKMQSVKHLFMVDGFSFLRMGAIGERARTGQPLSEPYGSTRRFLDFNELMFLPVQLSRFPLDNHQAVKTDVTIGKRATRPLRVSTPIMITGMAFGSALSKKAKIALAKASTLANTATNSGESGFMPEEREAAANYIVQWNRGRWSNRMEDLPKVDAVEIQVGQGAEGSLGNRVKAENIREDFRVHLGLQPGQDAVRPARFRHIDDPSQFKGMVDELREASGGAPIGLKFAASRIEEDCEVAIQAGVDFITIDGAQGGSGGGREVTINNAGVPLVYAIPRAHRYLQERGVRDQIDLIVTGGLRDAGDFLKAMALGADAVYIGESALLAMIFHQLEKMAPGTNPAQLFLYTGEYADQLDVDAGAQAVANFIKASTTEMQLLAQTVGKDDLHKVDRDDMVALSREIAEITGVQLAYMPQEVRTPPVPVLQ